MTGEKIEQASAYEQKIFELDKAMQDTIAHLVATAVQGVKLEKTYGGYPSQWNVIARHSIKRLEYSDIENAINADLKKMAELKQSLTLLGELTKTKIDFQSYLGYLHDRLTFTTLVREDLRNQFLEAAKKVFESTEETAEPTKRIAESKK